ncbi:MAG: leucine-rich repeat domain-containing protein [Bacteroidaceae bacterium]|nr:leucine-rich repeat domain-containing protein [Bacteroidaceae bacterium]
MKKHFFKSLLSIACLLCSIAVYAHDFEVDGIYYNRLSSTEVEVTCQGASGNSYSNEYTGTVVIPATVTSSGTTYNVTSIGKQAFYRCSSLTSVTIPNSVSSIGKEAFRQCSGLIEITIPNSVSSIDDYAFYGCTGLTEVTIPNSVTSIGSSAFGSCSGLTEITIPGSVTSIGDYAFSHCSGLTKIRVEDGNETYDSRENCTAIVKTATNTLIAGCKNSFIPNSVTSIGDQAFSGCAGLTEITIPESVTSIGEEAFTSCI